MAAESEVPVDIRNDPQLIENFAPEPEDYAQVHKVFTQNLEWLESDVRGLKRHTWRSPTAFGLTSIAVSTAVAGGLEIINYSGGYRKAPVMDWVLLVAG